MSLISVDDVFKAYPLGKTEVLALQGVSFQIEKGDFVSIAGPSGSGKSTILNMIGCMDKPTKGKVLINDKNISGLNEKEITKLRHESIGFIFQSFNLIPVLNVYENIEFPLLLGNAKEGSGKHKEWIMHLIKEVGLEQWTNHKPYELSGGQRQRVAVARALATKAPIILADEPTANLDSKTGQQILELMQKFNKDLNTTFIFSTHDPHVMELANHVIKLKDGLIEENTKRG